MALAMPAFSGNFEPVLDLLQCTGGVKLTGMEMKGILFDYARSARIGLPEAVFSEGKPFSALLALIERFAPGEPPILFTRLRPNVFELIPPALRDSYNYDPVSGTAWAATMPAQQKGSVAIISGGTSDAPVARESARTLEYLGIRHELMEDCGVAALWRLSERLPQINTHDVVIVIAGMEGALACVTGGLCPKPVFAVPTSVGYGVAEGGRTALSGMLASCAPGVPVLNIDNGYGAACAAARVINLL